MLRRQVGHEGHQQAQRGLQPAVPQPHPDPVHQPGQQQPDQDAHHGRVAEQQDRVGHDRVRPGRRGHGEAEDGQRGGVVDQALAGQDGHQPTGQAQLAADGQRGHRVRRRHHRAQHQPGDQGQSGHHPGRHRPGDQRRHHHHADAQGQDRPQAALEADEGEAQRGGVEQGRGDHAEDQVGPQLEAGQLGDERDGRREQHHHQRRLQPAPLGERGHPDRPDDDQQQLDSVHPWCLTPRRRTLTGSIFPGQLAGGVLRGADTTYWHMPGGRPAPAEVSSRCRTSASRAA
jgi:hypothetical protein